MAFTCCKGIRFWCWSLCCALSLTGDLKVCLQIMVSYQGIMVTAGLLWGAEPTARTTKGTQSYHLPRSSIFCERSSWQIGTICQGNGLDAAQSLVLPVHPVHFSGTHLLCCLLFFLWHWGFCVSLWRISVSISCEPCLRLFLHSQLSVFLENCYPDTSYFARLLMKPLPSFSRKAGSTALWLSPLVTRPSSLASLTLSWCCF